MELKRPGGARIHYEIRGESGPALLLASYWSWNPSVYVELLADLSVDHRVATYHLRGTGGSSRQGPFDLETDVGDLEAVAEAVGVPLILLSTADGSNRAARLGARRPELITAVISFGTAPFARASLEGEEGMATSDTVMGAFLEMLESNFRGGVRTIMEATNPQMSEAQLQDRVGALVEFAPQEAAVSRLRTWLEDDPSADARALGDRLWIFSASNVAGPWLPPSEQLARLSRELVPQANVVANEPGPVSDPAGTAEAIRRVEADVADDAQPQK